MANLLEKTIERYLTLDKKMKLAIQNGEVVGRFCDSFGVDSLIILDKGTCKLEVYQQEKAFSYPVAEADWSICENKNSTVLQLQHLRVVKNFKRRGIGQGVIKFLKRYAFEEGYNSIAHIGENGTEKFYVEMGFHNLQNDVVEAFDMKLMETNLN